jgi:exodeoxyribonuclease V beta subunit
VWDGYLRIDGREGDARVYHDDAGTAVIDFRLDDEVGAEQATIAAQMKLEAAAESLRLTYVALTRAVYRCYVIAGIYATRHSDTESAKSLLNWLVAGSTDSPAQWLAAGKPPTDIAAAWEALATRGAPHLAVAPLPADAGKRIAPDGLAPESLSALVPPTSIAPAWRFSSFSGLVSDVKSETAANDHDARIAEVATRVAALPPEIAADDILRFPRGPRAGECLHAIFEHIDFTEPAGWKDGVDRGLFAHPQFLPGARAVGQSSLLAGMAVRMLTNVMSVKLPGGIVLRSIPTGRRLTELEFSLPSPRVSANALNAMLKSADYDVPRLTFRTLEGYLKGYIDVVFEHGGRYYVLDWKSNHLGYVPGDYGPAELRAAMAEHGYHLQYLLYALAVDRYLKHRIPGYRHDAHFGGVFYLFVRGVRPDWVNADGTPAGVFHHRPSAVTLARLDTLFAPAQAKVAR